MLLLEMKYLTGAPLAELEGFMEAHEKYVEKINNDALLRSFAMFRDHINMLAVPDFSPADRLIEDRDILSGKCSVFSSQSRTWGGEGGAAQQQPQRWQKF